MEEIMLDEKGKKSQGKKMAGSVIFGVLTIMFFVCFCIVGVSTIQLMSKTGLETLGLIILLPVMIGLIILLSIFGIIWLILSVSIFKKSEGAVKKYVRVFAIISVVIIFITWGMLLAIIFKNAMLVSQQAESFIVCTNFLK